MRRLRRTAGASTGVAERSKLRDLPPTVALIGFMAAGKTTVARELDSSAIDSDREVERRAGEGIEEIFKRKGEKEFRRIEEEVVVDLLRPDSSKAQEKLASGEIGRVVSLGGGSVLSAAVKDALSNCLTVWLDVDVETAWRRSGSGEGDRPLARDREAFEALFLERREIYRELADAVVPSAALAGSGPGQRAAMATRIRGALATLAQLPRSTRLLWALSGGGSYPVYVGPGLISGPEGFGLLRSDEAATNCLPLPVGGRRFLVTDENVLGVIEAERSNSGRTSLAQTIGDPSRPEAEGKGAKADHLCVIPPGETAKTLEQVGLLIAQMAESGFTRADHVAALGGGVVGDLAGFCASVYQRGVPVVQLPTTVVAQVDSAYGGKTGVDLPSAKNYIGAYHQPTAVVTDTRLLRNLPPEELASGFVEALKTALLAGGRLWSAVRDLEPGSAEALADHPFLIFDCAAFKIGVVAADERDGNLRQILNLGHTVGHAIETGTEYRGYRHGEAVGLGLLAALRLSGADDLRDEVEGILSAWRLPVRVEARSGVPELTPEGVVELTRRDKKRLTGQTPFVLLPEPGDPQFGQTLPEADILAAVEELFAAKEI